MSFDVTGLSAYVANNSKEIATKAVANAQTAKLLIDNKQVQAGVKGSAAILKMDADVSFQDGASCSRSPLGSTKLSNKTISVKPIKDVTNICPKSLWNTYFAEMIQKGQAPEESLTPEFAQSIMDYRAAKISAEIEKLIWNGDLAATGTTNLKYIDGLVKQVGAGFAITASGADVIAKLQSVYLAMPVAVRQAEDFRMFIGEDTYAEYLVALSNKNVFKATDDFTLFGTTAKLQPTAGLNGSDKVYAARISNFHLGLDGEGDADSASMRFSVETENWYMDFKFALGVAVVEETEVGVASI